MNKHRINIFIALVLVLIIIAAVSMWLTSRDIKNTVPTESAQPAPALTPSVISTRPRLRPRARGHRQIERFALAECTARSDCRAAADAAGYKPHHKPDRQL